MGILEDEEPASMVESTEDPPLLPWGGSAVLFIVQKGDVV